MRGLISKITCAPLVDIIVFLNIFSCHDVCFILVCYYLKLLQNNCIFDWLLTFEVSDKDKTDKRQVAALT